MATKSKNTSTSKVDSNKLFEVIWQAANEVRGQMDEWEFKGFTLSLLSYRLLSLHQQQLEIELVKQAQERNIDPESDKFKTTFRKQAYNRLGYYLDKGLYFEQVLAHEKSEEPNKLLQELDRAFKCFTAPTIADFNKPSYDILNSTFSKIDVNSEELDENAGARQARFAALMNSIVQIEQSNKEHEADLLGDAYEYLMTMYASAAGKSGGEFYTPQEVSKLVARLATYNHSDSLTVYDPCCGSGSLLLRTARELDQKQNVRYFGQDVNATSFNLCRMNLLLHGVPAAHINIALGDTLANPSNFESETNQGKFESTNEKSLNFDVIISNPPYALQYPEDKLAELSRTDRFQSIDLPSADIAFVLHCLYHLNDKGTCALVLPEGLFSRPNEVNQRKHLINLNVVDAVIALPRSIFFGTNTKTCILVLKKNRQREEVTFIDLTDYVATTKRTTKGTKARKYLSDEGIELAITSLLENKKNPGVVHIANKDEIVANNYSLSPSYYFNEEDTAEAIDHVVVTRDFVLTGRKINVLFSQLETIFAKHGLAFSVEAETQSSSNN